MSAVLLKWSDAFNTGVADIDEQHKELVTILNRLKTSIANRTSRQACGRILDELVEYTQMHFRFEEGLMEASGYALLDSHKKLHEELLAQVISYRQKLAAADGSISFELLHFLQMWLIKHISESDKRFGQYFVFTGEDEMNLRKQANAPDRARKGWWRAR
jgi:hemerythrin